MKSNTIIFSSNQNFKELALKEIERIYKNSIFIKWLGKEKGIIKIDDNFSNVHRKFKENNVIFVRHIQPINFSLPRTNTKNDIYSILGLFKKIKGLLNKNLSYSIQTTFISKGKSEYGKKEIYLNLKTELSKIVGGGRFSENIKEPEQIISILIADEIYIGVSLTQENLSKWAGGEARFSAENIICRSEFKLLEIFENFDLDKYKIKKVLDLGCSPGGWSKLLLKKGYKVTGIDPALVDERVLKNPNFTHFKGTSESFVLKNTKKYDLIVNDMKMDFKNSIDIINSLKTFLNDGGLIIITIKLYENDISRISQIISRLKENYKILFARQFYNNRSEFTVILEKNNYRTNFS